MTKPDQPFCKRLGPEVWQCAAQTNTDISFQPPARNAESSRVLRDFSRLADWRPLNHEINCRGRVSDDLVVSSISDYDELFDLGARSKHGFRANRVDDSGGVSHC